jgi:hypothetical protein
MHAPTPVLALLAAWAGLYGTQKYKDMTGAIAKTIVILLAP